MNFRGSRLGFWFRRRNRAKTKRVLVFYDNYTYVCIESSGEGGTTINVFNDWYTTSGDVNPGDDVWPNIHAREIAAGNIPELVVGYANLPADLSVYDHIWDIGYVSPYASNPTVNPTSVLTQYIQQGGAMFMLGDNAGLNRSYPPEFPDNTRYETIIQFISGLNGGLINTNPYNPPIIITANILPQFLIVNNTPTVDFDDPGYFVNFDRATPVTEGLNIGDNMSYPAIMWETGSLWTAPLGAVMAILDVNFLTTIELQPDFIDNIIASLNQR